MSVLLRRAVVCRIVQRMTNVVELDTLDVAPEVLLMDERDALMWVLSNRRLPVDVCSKMPQSAGVATDTHDTLTRREAARLLGVHVKTLDRWARDGLVPAWRTPGGQRRYRRSELERLVTPEAA